MRVNPICAKVLPVCGRQNSKNAKVNNQKDISNTHSFPNKRNEVAFTSLKPIKIQEHHFNEISHVIRETDEARLDGSQLGVYKYGNFMTKAPDLRINDTAIKEFYALSRIRQAEPGCTAAPIPYGVSRLFPSDLNRLDDVPLPSSVSRLDNRFYLVEEFLEGKINPRGRYNLTEVTSALSNLLSLDKTGVTNQDLSPENTIYSPALEQMRFIDFDHYSYVSKSGRVCHSQSTPRQFFETMLDDIHVLHGGMGNILYKPSEEAKPEDVAQMFANSFFYKLKQPEGAHNLLSITNMPDNPYISVPSNLANYESRTIYSRIMAGEVDNPCEFLQEYLQIKGVRYHTGMKNFLQGLKIKDPPSGLSDKLSVEEAKERLNKAIEYEDFLAKLFLEKPDKYFAKLQAAKMQLNALLYSENLDKHVPNCEQIHSAYITLVDILTEGLYDYRSPEHQRYLNTELERYKYAFSKSAFITTSTGQKPVCDSLDIIKMWFSDVDKDPKSFSALRSRAKYALKEALGAICRDLHDYNLNPADIKAGYAEFLDEISVSSLSGVEDAFTTAQFQKERMKLIDETIAEFISGDMKKLAKDAEEAALRALKEAENEGQQTVSKVAKKGFSPHVSKVMRNFPSPSEQLARYTQEYNYNRLVKTGGDIALKAFIALGAIGFGVYQFLSYKNNHKKATLVTPETIKTKQDKMPVISKVTTGNNSLFKDFSI